MNNNNQNFKNIVKETIADVAVDGITRLICENEKGDFYAIIPDPNTGFDYESAKGFVLGITAADVEKSKNTTVVQVRYQLRNSSETHVDLVNADEVKNHKYAGAGIELFVYESPCNAESQKFVVVEKRSGLALLGAETKSGAIKALGALSVTSDAILQQVDRMVALYGELNTAPTNAFSHIW